MKKEFSLYPNGLYLYTSSLLLFSFLAYLRIFSIFVIATTHIQNVRLRFYHALSAVREVLTNKEVE